MRPVEPIGCILLQPAGTSERLREQIFDLPVDAAKVVVGPAANSVKQSRAEPDQKMFAL